MSFSSWYFTAALLLFDQNVDVSSLEFAVGRPLIFPFSVDGEGA